MKQQAIPFMQIRGGTSKGIYFNKQDLPANETLRNEVLLSALGRDSTQNDGLGGANPLTSKVAIVSKSEKVGVDIDYLFVQIVVGENRVDTSPNCGNILSGVGAFAIESGLIQAQLGTTTIKVNMQNSSNLCELVLPTPNGFIEYEGSAKIDGVQNSGAPIVCNYLDVAGSLCGSLFPTGNYIDEVDGISVTCIDNGMPVVLLKASDFGKSGYESCAQLSSDTNFKTKLESIRLQLGSKMNLGDVSQKVVPKMSLIAPPQANGHISTRTFIPHNCHNSIGVLGAVSVATAMIYPTITQNIAKAPQDEDKKMISVEHPSGQFTIELTTQIQNNQPQVIKAGLIRTARLLSRGELFIPSPAINQT